MPKFEKVDPVNDKVSNKFSKLTHGYKYICSCGKEIVLYTDAPAKRLYKCSKCLEVYYV